MLLEVLTLIVLAVIVIQDFISRSAYLFLFPILLLLFILLNVVGGSPTLETFTNVLFNLGFLGFQLIVLTAYFSVKRGAFTNITGELLGWGDILFLVCVAFYLPVLNYLCFYIGSLVLALLAWIIYSAFTKNKDRHIPLAGSQGMVLIALLVGSWFFKLIDITNDTLIMHFFT